MTAADAPGRAGRRVGGTDPRPFVGTLPRRLPGPTRQRRPALIATLALVVAGFAAVGGWLLATAGDTTEVLVAARAVPAGHPITADDLGAARLAATGLRAIAASDAASVMGQNAAVPLVAGQLINRDMLTGQAVPGAGAAMVGLSLQPGQLPGDGLAAGDLVRVFAVPGAEAADQAPAPPRVLADRATVYAMRADDSAGGNTVLTVVVADEQAGPLAALGSAGRIAVAKVPGP